MPCAYAGSIPAPSAYGNYYSGRIRGLDLRGGGSIPGGGALKRSLMDKKKYQREWIAKRRSDWIIGNGPCKNCGSWDQLEVDHINPEEKEYNISQIWSRKQEVRDKELAKCQVLCEDCHKEKTIINKEFGICRFGENHPLIKLTDNDVLEIRNTYKKGGITHKQIAEKYNVGRSTITEIINGVWRTRSTPLT